MLPLDLIVYAFDSYFGAFFAVFSAIWFFALVIRLIITQFFMN